MEMYNAFIELVKAYALKSIAGLGGIKAWVAKLVLNFIIKTLKKIGIQVSENLKAKKELEEYEKKLNDPNASLEDRKEADKDFLK